MPTSPVSNSGSNARGAIFWLHYGHFCENAKNYLQKHAYRVILNMVLETTQLTPIECHVLENHHAIQEDALRTLPFSVVFLFPKTLNQRPLPLDHLFAVQPTNLSASIEMSICCGHGRAIITVADYISEGILHEE